MAGRLGAEQDVPRGGPRHGKPKLYVLDMFPYPERRGPARRPPRGVHRDRHRLPLQADAGFNVLHPMGWDAFGLPAEQYAVETEHRTRGSPPRRTSITSAARSSRSASPTTGTARSIPPIPDYYKWTQWIFLQLYDTWYDPLRPGRTPRADHARARAGRSPSCRSRAGTTDPDAYRDSRRLAYRAEVPSTGARSWGRCWPTRKSSTARASAAGIRSSACRLTQWMLRITAYAERLVEDLDDLDWPRAIKEMQRNWIGRSEGAEVDFFIDDRTTRDMMADGPRPLVRDAERRCDPRLHDPSRHALRRHLHGARPRAPARRSADDVADNARPSPPIATRPPRKSDLDRTDLAKTKTGVFTGGYAINPVNGEPIPIWIADYVLMGYGTGAIMAVPGHDERDFEFAKTFDLPIVRVVAPSLDQARRPARRRPRPSRASPSIRGTTDRPRRPAHRRGQGRHHRLAGGSGLGKKTVNYKLRDWLFCRQRVLGRAVPGRAG